MKNKFLCRKIEFWATAQVYCKARQLGWVLGKAAGRACAGQALGVRGARRRTCVGARARAQVGARARGALAGARQGERARGLGRQRRAGRAGARGGRAAGAGKGARGGRLGGLGAAWACSWARLGVWCTSLNFWPGLTRYFPESLNEHCSSRNFSKKKYILKKKYLKIK